jgi:hypothetical protein
MLLRDTAQKPSRESLLSSYQDVKKLPASVQAAQQRKAPHRIAMGAKIRIGRTLSVPKGVNPSGIAAYKYGHRAGVL